MLHFRYVDPLTEIIEDLHKGYCEQLTASSQSWNVRISPEGLLLWGDSDQVKQVYDFAIRRAMSEGEQGSQIALTVIERGNMDECSVWCSKWQPGADILCGASSASQAAGPAPADEGSPIDMRSCCRIIELHGGHMWVETAPNSWAKLVFVLPKRNVVFS